MPNPKDNPVSYVNQAVLRPDDKSLPANHDGVQAIDEEIARLKARIAKLQQAREQIKARIK